MLTDEAGRFTFPGTPPGETRFRVEAGVSDDDLWRIPSGTAGLIDRSRGGKTVEVRLAMPAEAVIAGTVRDQLGDPAPGVDVFLIRFTAANPGAQVHRRHPHDRDRGMYRAFGLMPDEYVVAALPARFFGDADTFAPSREEVDAKLRRLEQRFAQTQTVNPSQAPEADEVRSLLLPRLRLSSDRPTTRALRQRAMQCLSAWPPARNGSASTCA